MFKNPRTYPALAFITGLVLLIGLIVFVQGHREPAAPARPVDSKITEVTTENFVKVVMQSQTPVFIEFYAPGCKDCAQEDPILEKLANDYQGKLVFVRVDGVAQGRITQLFQVQTVPTHVFLVPSTKQMAGGQGFADEATLRAFVDRALSQLNAKPDASKPDDQHSAPSAPNTPTAPNGSPGAPNATPKATPTPDVAPKAPDAPSPDPAKK